MKLISIMFYDLQHNDLYGMRQMLVEKKIFYISRIRIDGEICCLF